MESLNALELNDDHPLQKGELVTMRDQRKRATAQRELGTAPYVIAKVASTGLYIVRKEDFDKGVDIPDGHPLMLPFSYLLVLPEHVMFAGPQEPVSDDA